MRIDVYLTQKGIIETRNKAQELIRDGHVFINGKKVKKVSTLVSENDKVTIDENSNVLKYVSRGGLKLEKALNFFNYDMKDKCVIDIGASTGGFTDCALKHGAKKVISVDVGTKQLHPSLLDDDRVCSYENTDIRKLNKDIVKDVSVAVMDLSFISVTKIIEYIKDYPNLTDVICLIKPQFECGMEIASKYKGIILDKEIHNKVLKTVTNSFLENGFYLNGLTPSSIRGGDGNIEYLGFFSKKNNNANINFVNIICEAFKN